MAKFLPAKRERTFLLSPDMRDWLPEDDLAHFVIVAAERVSLALFAVNDRGSGGAQYHPRMMLALLVYCYANGLFSSRRIERATYRDLSVRFVAANTWQAFEAAFTEILLLAREVGLTRLGTVSIDGTKIDAIASWRSDCEAAGGGTTGGAFKLRSVRYDRAQALREKLRANIAALTEQAEAADANDQANPQALPGGIARRVALKAKLDAACSRLEAEAAEAAEQARPAHEAKDAAWRAGKGRRGRPPVPPDPKPPADRQINLTDPDSGLMRRSDLHEYRQCYNAQAVVDADGSQLVLATHVTRSPSDAPSFADVVLSMAQTIGLPERVLADAGFASEWAVEALQKHHIEPLVAIARTPPHRPYDFRPPPDNLKPKHDFRPPPDNLKPKRRASSPWRLVMQDKMQTNEARTHYRKALFALSVVV